MHHSVRSRLRPLRHVVVLTVVALAAVLVAAGPAAADTIQFTGQGTNADGSCANFDPSSSGTQTWHFNLTQTQPGATMSASFSDGTTVTNKAEDDHNGNTSFWFIVTDAGATLTSASATFTPSGPNSQFVVSDCMAGGEKPPPTTPETTPETTPTTAAPNVTPTAPAPVVAAARFTG